MVNFKLKKTQIFQLLCCKTSHTTKLIILLLSLFIVEAQAFSVAQEARVTLDCKNTPLEDVFRNIEKQTNLYFFFSNNILDVDKHITISAKSELLERVLEKLLGKDYNYSISDKLIIIDKKEHISQDPPPADKQPTKVKVTGVVKDVKGETLIGATVIIKDTQKGVTTDANGVFSIDLDPAKKNTIVVSYIGMKKREVTVGEKRELSIILEEESSELSEVVITGIFKKASTAFTGSATVVTASEIKKFEGRNLVSTLANIDPAFNIIQNNEAGFDPNRLPDLQIRGTSSLVGIKEIQDGSRSMLNTPLILLDGFEISLQRMMDLDSDEVASVTLLKDGSATAIYGSRGANGIIVITTKEPEKGKLKFSYSGNLNIEVPDLSDYHLLNARDKLELERLSGFYTAQGESNSLLFEKLYAKNKTAVERGVNTYWLSKPLRVGIGQRHNLKVEGGDQSFRYSVSAMYNQLLGVMKKSGRTTFNGSINLSYIHNNLIFNNNLSIGNTKGVESPYGNFSDYVRLNPYWKPYDDDGNIVKFFDTTSDYFWGGASKFPRNPLYDAMLPTIDEKSYTSIINTFSIEWRPSQYFTVRGNAGINYQLDETDDFKPRTHTSFEGYFGEQLMRKGKYIYKTGKNFNYLARLTASYSRLLNEKHNVYVGLSSDLEQSRSRGYAFTVEGFTQENPKSLIMGLYYPEGSKPTGYEAFSRRVGTVANFNYSFDDRYFSDISYRIDGSSQFGKNKRFAPFFSMGLGWNLHNEKFLRTVPFIDRLTLRTSYGQNGSQQFQSFQAIATYDYYVNDRYHEWMGIFQKALDNPNLEWQKTNKYNIGIDADLLKNRLAFRLDVYRENTNNMLSSRWLPLSSGFTSYMENIGEVQNNGFELRVIGNIIRNTSKNIFLNVSASIANNESKMVRLSEALKQAYSKEEAQTKKDPSRIIREGDALNTIYAVKSLGIDPSNGRELFLKRNGDVTYNWSSEDLVACGSNRPKYRGVATTSLRYKNLSLNMAFSYYWGGQIYNSTLLNKIENADKHYNVDERVYYDRWKSPGDHTFFKGINNLTPTYATSRFVQNDNVFTCKNIQLSYEIRGNKMLKRYTGLESLIFKADASDIFYWSTVRQERGINYPFSRRFSTGISMIF